MPFFDDLCVLFDWTRLDLVEGGGDTLFNFINLEDDFPLWFGLVFFSRLIRLVFEIAGVEGEMLDVVSKLVWILGCLDQIWCQSLSTWVKNLFVRLVLIVLWVNTVGRSRFVLSWNCKSRGVGQNYWINDWTASTNHMMTDHWTIWASSHWWHIYVPIRLSWLQQEASWLSQTSCDLGLLGVPVVLVQDMQLTLVLDFHYLLWCRCPIWTFLQLEFEFAVVLYHSMSKVLISGLLNNRMLS